MESIKHTIDELTQMFNAKIIQEFQKELKRSTLTTSSPSTNDSNQFNSFRTFVLVALENLQRQVEYLFNNK
ncbi:unnamed protein product [Euphydryas editha]|uniref:Uncharacterized protein n=1 Tax=Euphydryas editha TaxID=104508 RepID=A0AAU9V3E7_EUPED|nr:unnamed protein product [Euphydryas editha]